MARNNNAVWIVILVVVLAFFLFVMPFGGGNWGGVCGMMSGYGSTGWGMMGSFGGMAFGWLFMLVVLVALVLLIFWLVNQMQHPEEVSARSRRRR